MKLDTKHFGVLEIDKGQIMDFSEGIPGFEQAREFVFVDGDDGQSPFKWLQCVDKPELAFVVADPFVIMEDYEVSLNDETVSSLGIESVNDVKVCSIVVIPEDTAKISMNLKAPVIINTRNNKGKQLILDTDRYSVRHYILEELRRQEVAGDACADKEKGPVDNNK